MLSPAKAHHDVSVGDGNGLLGPQQQICNLGGNKYGCFSSFLLLGEEAPGSPQLEDGTRCLCVHSSYFPLVVTNWTDKLSAAVPIHSDLSRLTCTVPLSLSEVPLCLGLRYFLGYETFCAAARQFASQPEPLQSHCIAPIPIAALPRSTGKQKNKTLSSYLI